MFEDTDNIYGLIKKDEELWSEISTQAQTVFKDWIKHVDGTSGKKAKSWQDAGRGCPRCSDILKFVEIMDTGAILLQCKSCNLRVFNTDIEPYSKKEKDEMKRISSKDGIPFRDTPDELYRSIPDSLILEYTQMRENQMKQQ